MNLYSDLTSSDFIEILKQFNRTIPLGRVLAMVEEAGCKTIIEESGPEEKEYAKEYEAFFKNVFAITDKKKVHRLHFFEGIINSLDEIKEKDGRYFGYCDIRPTKKPSLSCVLLDKKVFIKENAKFLFLVCHRMFSVTLGGKELEVDAFPYVQQDGRVIRCAQAALSSISSFLDKKLTGPDFTHLASEIPDGHRQIPSRGMTGQQIGISWEKLDFEPVLYDYMLDDYARDANKVELQHREQIIYRYLESGLPVLIGINAGSEMHALVVIGHTFTPDSWQAQTNTIYFQAPKTGFYYHCCTNWIERFVVQDDNLGPYTLILSDFLQFYGCKLITVGLPPGIFLMPEDAEMFVGDLFSPNIYRITDTFDYYIDKHKADGNVQNSETVSWYEEFKFHADNHDLVLRTYLRESEHWRESIANDENYEEYKDNIEKLTLPKFVWVVEISWPFIFRHSRRLCGEVLIDPTDEISPSVNFLDQGWLLIKVPGVIMTREATTDYKSCRVLEQKDTVRPHHFTSK